MIVAWMARWPAGGPSNSGEPEDQAVEAATAESWWRASLRTPMAAPVVFWLGAQALEHARQAEQILPENERDSIRGLVYSLERNVSAPGPEEN
jgi:hypothetical protein